jgi:hypothetical protein
MARATDARKHSNLPSRNKHTKHDVVHEHDFGASHGPSPGVAKGNEFNHDESHGEVGRGMTVIASGLIDPPTPGGDNEMDAAIKKEAGRTGRGRL